MSLEDDFLNLTKKKKKKKKVFDMSELDNAVPVSREKSSSAIKN